MAVEGVFEVVDGQLPVAQDPDEHAGVDAARAGGHDQSLEGCEAHGGIHRPTPGDGRQRSPRSEVGGDEAKRAGWPAEERVGPVDWPRRGSGRGIRSGATRGHARSRAGHRLRPRAASSRGRRCRSTPPEEGRATVLGGCGWRRRREGCAAGPTRRVDRAAYRWRCRGGPAP